MKLLSFFLDEDPASKTPLAPELEDRLAELKNRTVHEIMTPRPLVFALDIDVQLRRVRRLKSAKSQFFPVYKGDLDHILGWVPKMQVLELLNEPSEEGGSLEQHIRPAGNVFEDTTIPELADQFLHHKSPFLAVKSREGTVTGIAAMQDFIDLVFGMEPVSANLNSPPVLESVRLFDL